MSNFPSETAADYTPSKQARPHRRLSRVRVRGVIADLHAWIGAAVGIFMILIGATGMALGFAYELMRAETGGFEVSGPLPDGAPPVADYVEGAKNIAGPDFIPLGYLGPHAEIVNPAPMIFGLTAPPDAGGEGMVITIDPATGETTSAFLLYDTWTHWLIDLHFEMLGGSIGAAIMAVIALLLVALAIAGLILWWPIKRSALKKITSFSWRGNGFRKAFSLHSLCGFWLALPVLAWSLSGAYWSQPNWFPQAITPQLDAPPEEVRMSLEGANCAIDATPQDAVEIALSRFPGATVSEVDFAAPWQPWHAVHLDVNGGDPLDGDTRVWVAAACAETTASANLFGSEASGPFLKALHGGRIFGPLRQFIVAVVGLGFVLLGITGLMLWWHRLKDKYIRSSTSALRRRIVV